MLGCLGAGLFRVQVLGIRALGCLGLCQRVLGVVQEAFAGFCKSKASGLGRLSNLGILWSRSSNVGMTAGGFRAWSLASQGPSRTLYQPRRTIGLDRTEARGDQPGSGRRAVSEGLSLESRLRKIEVPKRPDAVPSNPDKSLKKTPSP